MCIPIISHSERPISFAIARALSADSLIQGHMHLIASGILRPFQGAAQQFSRGIPSQGPLLDGQGTCEDT